MLSTFLDCYPSQRTTIRVHHPLPFTAHGPLTFTTNLTWLFTTNHPFTNYQYRPFPFTAKHPLSSLYCLSSITWSLITAHAVLILSISISMYYSPSISFTVYPPLSHTAIQCSFLPFVQHPLPAIRCFVGSQNLHYLLPYFYNVALTYTCTCTNISILLPISVTFTAHCILLLTAHHLPSLTPCYMGLSSSMALQTWSCAIPIFITSMSSSISWRPSLYHPYHHLPSLPPPLEAGDTMALLSFNSQPATLQA